MSKWNVAYFSVGVAAGGIIANMEIGWWGVLIAFGLGMLIGATTALWERRVA